MGVSISVVIATYGGYEWQELASIARNSVPVGEDVVVEHQPEGTLASARNAGAERANCEWLCFLDADDRLGRGYLSAMRSALAADWHTGPPLLAPSVSYVEDGRSTVPEIPNAGRWPKMNECVIGTLVLRDLFLEVGGFHEWDSLEDYELWLRCVAAGAQIAHVPSAVYRAHRQGSKLGIGRNRNQSPYREIVKLHRRTVIGLA